VTTEELNSSANLRLEKSFRRSQIWAAWAQVGAMLAALLTAAVAVYVARQSQATVNRDTQNALQQSEDAQLSTAIAALGSTSASERVAGLLLLTQNTAGRFALAAKTGESPAQLFDDYTTALQTLSAYLSSASTNLLASTAASQPGKPFGRGYGTLVQPAPIDLQYAVDQVRFLMTSSSQREVMSQHLGRPAIDLSSDELSGANLTNANFGWVYGYLFAIDLRGATLEYSHWSSRSDLSTAYLQCADLRHADFRGANLSYADLSGADVQGADFTGANLRGLKAAYVYGTAKWLAHRAPVAMPVQDWRPLTCLANSKLWEKAPVASTPSQPASKRSRSHGK
jgi:Pentapeptide repeats (8 copies)